LQCQDAMMSSCCREGVFFRLLVLFADVGGGMGFCRMYDEVERSSLPGGHRHVLFILTLYDDLYGCCPCAASPFHLIK
ncbi:hypothetical protein, partial [Janthinobacterium sp. UMAB-56]|uniref:hypothetical protein n=1 Tax=Janthinobacterium sp. UMAB-56 TaxID=1365361 RepID=UPI001C564590